VHGGAAKAIYVYARRALLLLARPAWFLVTHEKMIELHVKVRDVDGEPEQVGGDFIDGGMLQRLAELRESKEDIRRIAQGGLTTWR